jgi:hypothetical protein
VTDEGSLLVDQGQNTDPALLLQYVSDRQLHVTIGPLYSGVLVHRSEHSH